MIKIAHLNDAFSEIFDLEASLEEVQKMWQKDKERWKGKAKDVGHYCAHKSKNL